MSMETGYDPSTPADTQFFPNETESSSIPHVISENDENTDERDTPDPIYDDPGGSMFSGPVGTSVPVSLTHSRRRSTSRAGSSRRNSIRSSFSRSSLSLHSVVSPPLDGDDQPERRKNKGKQRARRSSEMTRDEESGPRGRDKDRKSMDEDEREEGRGWFPFFKTSMDKDRDVMSDAVSDTDTSNHPLRGRSHSHYSRKRRSLSRSSMRSRDSGDEFPEDSDDEDPYGPYGSSSGSSASTHSSDEMRRESSFLPFTSGVGGGGHDEVFGEDEVDEAWKRDVRLELPAAEGDMSTETPSSQPIYIVAEDLPILFKGFGTTHFSQITWTIWCIFTFGLAALIARWFPAWGLRRRGTEKVFKDAEDVVVYVEGGGMHICPVKTIKFRESVLEKDIFEKSLTIPQRWREDSTLPNDVGSLKDVKMPLNSVKAVDFRYYRFILHPVKGRWIMLKDWSDSAWKTKDALKKGVDENLVNWRLELFGPNVIDIESRGIATLLLDEVLHPFYIFQIASIILWSLDDYYYYATCIALISAVSITSTLIETRTNIERMREMSRFVCDVTVFRSGNWVTLGSNELVPGDLIDVSRADFHTIPTDLVLLSGEAIVNESMLTGESVPVPKVSIEQPHVIKELTERPGELSPEASRHVLYSGTRVVRMRKSGEGEAVAMVLLTAFNTTKGALVRSMLFPKPMGFKFYRDSFRFIGVLAGIAGLGFIVSSIRFVELGIEWSTIAKRAADLVTIVVPPALPATMSIGTTFAISRLRRMGIFCISPNRVNVGGKVNLICFDKTGTLTEDGLDVLGVRSVDRSQSCFTHLFTDIEDVPIFGAADSKTPLLHALATCHALRVVDGNIVGDPLDLRMFEFTRWSLEEGKETQTGPSKTNMTDRREADRNERGVGKVGGGSKKVPERVATLVQMVVRPPGGERFQLEEAIKGAGKKRAHFLELGVIRTFDFVSALRRMTVLVKKLKSQTVEIYTKGAPEVMSEICDKSTLPHDFDDILAEYTKKGFRVIAVAAKSVPGLTWLKAQRMKREQAESDLRFLGLIVFENKLKRATEPAIYALRSAHIACRMCTGDNVRTAISVARECGMVSPDSTVYLPTFIRGGSEDPDSTISWIDVDRPKKRLDPYSLRPVAEYDEDDTESASAFSLESSAPYHLAISGDVFRWMIDYGARETLHRMLVKGIVYARMSPDEKQELVERLQGLGYITSFCGDGANDCGALKAADVGISLSEAEASVAAPFTSRVADISCVLDVIKEGRAALVTSFSCFKFMALYSLIQFTTVTILYSMASSLGDFQFLYIDLFLILPLAVTMGRTEPYTRIVPKRPTANLISKKVLTSLIGQIAITSGFQLFIFSYVRAQSWYKKPTDSSGKPDDLEIASYENSSLFLVSCFQYILVATVFCVGPPYRKPLTSNVGLVTALIALILANLYLLLVTTSFSTKVLELVSFPREFRSELLLLITVDCVLGWIFETWASQHVAKMYGNAIKTWRRWWGTRKSDGRLYKSIERDME